MALRVKERLDFSFLGTGRWEWNHWWRRTDSVLYHCTILPCKWPTWTTLISPWYPIREMGFALWERLLHLKWQASTSEAYHIAKRYWHPNSVQACKYYSWQIIWARLQPCQIHSVKKRAPVDLEIARPDISSRVSGELLPKEYLSEYSPMSYQAE